MPRPGPRPYECVRRAWHSDRHQPMRGSLIQEIFRVANEVHRPATRKNKEWQEKLPIVVLRAEEIMYSKANSEAEYMDLQTLWDRANDAINTIIRRDDDTPESRDFLHPCIEAALNLGCTPRRASRSQRHSNPGFYLSSSMKEAAATSPKIPDNSMAQLGSSTELLPSPPPHPNNLPGCASQLASWYLALATSNTINSGHSKAVSLTPDTFYEQNNSSAFSPGELPFLSKDALISCQDASLSIPMATCTWSNLGRVYPLYYSSSQHKASSQLTLENPHGLIGKTATAAALPCVPPVGELETCFLDNFPDINTTMDASNTSLNFGESSEYPPNSGCDLSLRLGPPSPSYLGSERAWALGVEDVGSSSSCDESKLCDLSPSRARARNFESSLSSPKDKGFDFFHLDTTDEPIESCSSKGSSEVEGESSAAASDEKHKSCIGGSSGDGYICWK